MLACVHCDKVFVCKRNYDRHKCPNKGQELDLSMDFTCFRCDVIFQSQSEWKSHQVSRCCIYHIHFGDIIFDDHKLQYIIHKRTSGKRTSKMYQCKKCFKDFQNPKDVEKHKVCKPPKECKECLIKYRGDNHKCV